MVHDLVQLPNRMYGTNPVFSTLLTKREIAIHQPPIFGREVSLQPFWSNKIKRYKLIESIDDCIIERLFLTQCDVDLRNSYDAIYPLQIKIIPYQSALVGHTFKYVQGITKYLVETDPDPKTPYTPKPVILWQIPRENQAMMNKADLNKLYSIIPCPDDNSIFNPASYQEFHGPYDRWLDAVTTIGDMGDLNIDAFRGVGNSILGETEVLTEDAYLYDNNPIGGNWEFYHLIEYLNCLAISDVTITVTRSTTNFPNVETLFTSRYSNTSYLDEDKLFANELIMYFVYHLVRCNFEFYSWTKVVIRKTWAEEIFIEVYCSVEGRSTEIIYVIYIDLIAFILGTIGLY